MVEPVALGDRPRELVGADRPLVEQQRLGWHPGRAGFLHRRLHGLGTGVAELDQDVGDETARVAAVQRRGEAERATLTRTRHRGRGRAT